MREPVNVQKQANPLPLEIEAMNENTTTATCISQLDARTADRLMWDEIQHRRRNGGLPSPTEHMANMVLTPITSLRQIAKTRGISPSGPKAQVLGRIFASFGYA